MTDVDSWKTTVERASRVFMLAAERTTTLYELSEEYTRLVDLLEDPEADAEQVEAEIDRIEGQIQHKAEAIAGLVAWYEGLSSLRKAEARRMADSVGRLEKQAERLRAYVLKHMQATGLRRIDTSRFTLSVRQNPPRVDVLEAMLIPSEFNRTRVIVEPDKTAIRDHWKATGEIVPGTEIVRGERLEIR